MMMLRRRNSKLMVGMFILMRHIIVRMISDVNY